MNLSKVSLLRSYPSSTLSYKGGLGSSTQNKKNANFPLAAAKSALLTAAIIGGLIYKGKLFLDKKLQYQAEIALKKVPNIVSEALSAKKAAKNNLDSVINLINKAKGADELVVKDKLVKFQYELKKPAIVEEYCAKTGEILRKTTINDKFFEIINYKNGVNSYLINKDRTINKVSKNIAIDENGASLIKQRFNYKPEGFSLEVDCLDKKGPRAKFRKLYIFNKDNELVALTQKEKEFFSTFNFSKGKVLSAEIVNNDGIIKDFEFDKQKSQQTVKKVS